MSDRTLTDVPAGRLLERERELTVIDGVLAGACRGAGGMVAFEGEAGVGKSRLLAGATDLARERGMSVLGACGEELERSAPWGLVRRLLAPALASPVSENGLSSGGPERLVARLFDRSGGAPEVAAPASEDVLAIAHAVFWTVSDLAQARPLLLVVDDAQWVDGESLRLLAYLLGRLADLPVAVLLGRRPREASVDPRGLDAIAADARVQRLVLAPLSVAAVGVLVSDVLGPDLAVGVVEACAAMTRGNPFYLHELLLELVKLPPGSVVAEAVTRLAPESVARAVFVRLARLDPACAALARAASVLGEGAAFPHVIELAEIDVESATRAFDALAAAELLRSPEPLGFAHPLVAEVIRADIGAGARGELHLRAARMLDRDGEESAKVAAHLLLAGRRADQWVVATLRLAAGRALARGATAAAAVWLERALGEPPAAEQRAGLLIELARAEMELGRPAAVDRLRAAAELVPSGGQQARVCVELGRALALQGRAEDAALVFEQGLCQLPDPDSELARELRAAWWSVASLQLSLRTRARRSEPVALPPADQQPTPGERQLFAQLAMHRAFEGAGRGEVVGFAQRAWGDGELLALEGGGGAAWPMVAGALFAADELERDLVVCDAVLADARRRGSPMAYASASYTRAWPLLAQGRVAEAVADASAAILARHDGWRALLGSAAAILVFGQVERGDLAAAREALELVERDEQLQRSTQYPMVLIAAGRLLIAEGRPTDALQRLLLAGEILAAAGIECPSPLPWRAYASFAAGLLGDRELARSLAEQALAAARGVDAPLAIARALRALARTERGEEAIESHRQAVAQLDGLPPRLERAHGLVELGAALRRARRRSDGRDALREGLVLADRGGALALADRARVELQAAGAHSSGERRGGPAALTPSETRVAKMAAGGMTNRAIAQALFVTVKAVEYHLANTFRKLDISRRGQIAGALAEGDAGAVNRGR